MPAFAHSLRSANSPPSPISRSCQQVRRDAAPIALGGLATVPNQPYAGNCCTNGFETWIWDNTAHWPPRKVYGFYSKDSLQYLIRQRSPQQELAKIIPDKEIAGRLYQIEAVTRVLERFQNRRRKTLIVQATGTGKTRVAISLCEALIRAGWAKRILFLCDRRELRKQAHNAFKEFLPDEPRVYVTARPARNANTASTWPPIRR